MKFGFTVYRTNLICNNTFVSTNISHPEFGSLQETNHILLNNLGTDSRSQILFM